MFKVSESVLLVIDVQGKLASQMFELDRTVKNIQGMIKGAKILGIPILWTEQVPEKIGTTIPEISGLLSGQKPIKKTSFSCWPNKRFQESLAVLNRKQIIVTGIEAHVCVYQTSRDLLANGFQIQAVTDAISSRTESNRRIGLDAIKSLNAQMTSAELTLCELLETAANPKFKEILKLIR